MFIERLSNQLNDLHTSYDKILLLDDFNMIPEDLKLQDFCDTHDLENLIKDSICFNHGTIIRTGTTCKKIHCYMRGSACRWYIVENAKIFGNYVKIFEFSYVK